jgi:hypothetical protein
VFSSIGLFIYNPSIEYFKNRSYNSNMILESSIFASGEKGGVMHKSIWAIIIIVIVSAAPIGSQAQEAEGYTFLSGSAGPLVCVGQYTAPSSSDVTGVCQGQLFGLQQFSAVSARQSVDRLDRIAAALEAIDEKLAANNEQLQLLTEVTANKETDMVKNEIGLLSEAIDQRFEAVPEDLIADSRFRQALDKLKSEIMAEVEKRMPAAKKK